MLKIIVVDDDNNVREFIKKIVDWDSEGFVICGEAVNGKKGLQLAIDYQPDIIILDLEMPVMDGIEMLKLLIENHIQSKVIVLSCHNEFDYVKDAMKLGAFDYILKHKMKHDDFLKILKDIKRMISMNETNSGNIDYIKERALLDILKHPGNSPQYILDKLDPNGLGLENYFLISVEVDYYYKAAAKNDVVIIKGAHKLVSSYFMQIGDYLCCKMEDRLFAVLCIIPKNTSNTFEIKKTVHTLLSDIKKDFQTQYGHTISAGISSLCTDCSEIPIYWEQAKTALNNKFYKGTNSIIFYSEVSYNDNLMQINIKLYEFKSVISSREDALKVLNELFGTISDSCIEYKNFLKIFHNLVFILTTYIEKLGMELDEIFDPHNFLYDIQKDAETLQDYKDWLIELCNRINAVYDTKRENKYSKEIIKALDYMHANYTKELTLEEVSHHISISRNYFSQLFKKETGVNFINYIVKLRLEKAKELLQQKDMKIFSIAYTVGFQSHSYFNNTFKEYEGITPKQYRDSL